MLKQEGMLQLERQMRKICALCEEREALAQKDRQLYNGMWCGLLRSRRNAHTSVMHMFWLATTAP